MPVERLKDHCYAGRAIKKQNNGDCYAGIAIKTRPVKRFSTGIAF